MLNKLAIERNSQLIKYMDSGMSPLDSIRLAKKNTDFEKIRDDINNIVRPVKSKESVVGDNKNNSDEPVVRDNGITYIKRNGIWLEKK